jgi:enterochelin esterase-like enzyme
LENQRHLSRLIAEGAIPPMIVIGVDQMGISRPYEYLPYKDTIFDPDSPEPAGKLFPDFLAHDILPLIDGRYRTTKVPRMIGGASYGAVAALYALLARPDLFDAGLIESPSPGSRQWSAPARYGSSVPGAVEGLPRVGCEGVWRRSRRSR